jgi:hypothetical protein
MAIPLFQAYSQKSMPRNFQEKARHSVLSGVPTGLRFGHKEQASFDKMFMETFC